MVLWWLCVVGSLLWSTRLQHLLHPALRTSVLGQRVCIGRVACYQLHEPACHRCCSCYCSWCHPRSRCRPAPAHAQSRRCSMCSVLAAALEPPPPPPPPKSPSSSKPPPHLPFRRRIPLLLEAPPPLARAWQDKTTPTPNLSGFNGQNAGLSRAIPGKNRC